VILVLGGAGMLGHKMFQTMSGRFPDVKCTFRVIRPGLLVTEDQAIEGVDVEDFDTLATLITELAPEVVVNCVGVVKQRETANDPILTIRINSLLPHLLADWQARHGGRVVHFSTDCVFSGRKGNYREEDTPDPEDLYGRTKLLGETVADNALTIRSSIIGREIANRQSLLEWFLSHRGGKVRGYRKVIYSGVTTVFMSKLVSDIVESRLDISGLYHVSSPAISKYDLLCMYRDAVGLDIEVEPDDETVSDRSMVSDRFWAKTGYEQPDWTSLIAGLKEDKTPYDSWTN